MNDALIGFSGFVGSTLLKQHHFKELYRSNNISDITGKKFQTVVCAGAPAQKWIANREPATDYQTINNLITHLKTIKCQRFILISTVDVFKNAFEVDEKTVIDEVDLNPYGLHRRMLEKLVEIHFSDYLIVRLPGLVGPGLRKNIIYDFLNNNNLNAIDSRGVFQFYPMVNLWYDIQTAIDANLKLVHLTAEPISVASVASNAYGIPFSNQLDTTPAQYDMRSCHAPLFSKNAHYQYSQRETIQAIRTYAQSEPISIKPSV